MASRYERTVAGEGSVELEIRKSRFLATVLRATSEDEARLAIETRRKEHWSANHTCTAWRIGPGGRLQRTNDDGEPGGSAGVPMLEVLKRHELTDVVAMVTRYFGGIKLGVGGLIRAYGTSTAEAIAAAGVVERQPLHVLSVTTSHADAGKFEHALRNTTYALEGVTYNAAGAQFELALPERDLAPFEAFVAAVTAGASTPVENGTRLVDVPVVPGSTDSPTA